MAGSSGEQRAREIEETAARYQANHWRNWVIPFAVFLLPLVFVVPIVGLAVLVRLGLERLGVDRDWATAVKMGVILLGVFGMVFAFIWFERRWRTGDPRLALRPSLGPKERRYRRLSEALDFGVILLFASAMTYASPSPRFYPLATVAFVAALRLKNALLAKRTGVVLARGRVPLLSAAMLLYTAYALAVAAGMPQVGGEARCPFSVWGLFFGLMLLAMALSPIYSHLQFRRLQRLVARSAPEGGE